MVDEGGTDADKLRAEKEAKLAAIAEKKAKIEELKKKKAEQQVTRHNPVDALLTNVLYTPGGEGQDCVGANIPRPMAWKNRSLKCMLSVTAEDIPPPAADATEKESQTDFEELEVAEPKALFKNWVAVGGQMQELTEDEKGGRKKRPMRMFTATGALAEEEAKKDGIEGGEEAKKEIEEMPAEERDKILKDKEFIKFVDKAAKVIEELLAVKFDVAVDYAHDSLLEKEVGDEEQLVRLDEYEESLPGQGRPITDCCFSPHDEKLFLAAYAQKDDSPIDESDGELLLWNMDTKNKAQSAFICDSAVLTAICDRYDPNIIWGGTYSGSVCMWDIRATARPVHRTLWPHSHPVYAIQQVGPAGSSTLVSVSTDGKVNLWSLPELGSPQKSIELKRGGSALAATSMHFADKEKPDICYVGCEDGTTSQVRLGGEGETGVVQTYEGHDGPVMSVDCRGDMAGTVGDLFLSTSVDWTVRLWSASTREYPILQIEAWEDMVYDAVWHPQQPAVFAAVDGDGNVDLWNLSTSTDGPLARCESSRQTALNRCSFAPTGKYILVGDSDGTVGLFSVGGNIAQPPRSDDFMNFETQVNELLRVAGLPADEIAHDDDEDEPHTPREKRDSVLNTADGEEKPAEDKSKDPALSPIAEETSMDMSPSPAKPAEEAAS